MMIMIFFFYDYETNTRKHVIINNLINYLFEIMRRYIIIEPDSVMTTGLERLEILDRFRWVGLYKKNTNIN